jgi:TonB-linked SusC/RagA family outer membrane protein
MITNYLKVGKLRAWVILAGMLMCSVLLQAQVTLSGKVTDSRGNAVPGATIAVRNTTVATVSNGEGLFSVATTLRPGPIEISISSVGLKTERRTINAQEGINTIDVSLPDDVLGLDEVVVTGTSAGTTRKQLGSFISTVKSDQINKGVPANALQALQGKTAGAQIIQNSGDPAGGMSVRLRGISTVNSSSEPLYIVDGIIVNNATNRVTNTQSGYDGGNFVGSVGQNRMVDINPADIERIEVLNGAAASAIYGSRANSGVIQIFTKRGASGKPNINFSTNYISSSLRKQVPINNAPTKFGGPTDGPGAFTQDILSPGITTTTPVTRYNYWDYIFQNASGTDNNISMSGGNENTKYFASASYFFNEGIVKNTDFQRFSFRVNLDQKINNFISAQAGINYVNSSANEMPDGNSFFSPMNSVTIIGNFHDIWRRDGNGNLMDVGERGRVNPVSVIEDFKQRQETSRVLANLGFKIKPFKGFLIDYLMGIDNYSQVGSTFIPPFTYNVSPAFWGGGPSLDPTQNGYASAATNNFFQINHELNGTYQFDINDKLSSTTQVGYQMQYERNKYLLAQGRGLSPAVETVNGASTILPGVDSRSELSISGLYLQQNFKWNNEFFLTGAIRQDQSSVFGPNQRNQVYLKASGSWLLSESKWWEKTSVSKWWDLAKVRVAYGQSGNLTGIGAYERFNIYTSNAFLGRTALQSLARQANLEVKPERQDELEFGTDLGFLGNRVTLTANYYIKKVNDLLLNRNVAPTTGFSTLLDNFGSLENRGFEIVLGGTPVMNKDFRWDVTGIYNRNRNKAVEIGQALTLFSTNGGAPVAIIEGQPIGLFYGTFFATDPSGTQIKNPAGIPLIERGTQNSVLGFTPARGQDGLPLSTATILRRIIGDPNPDYTATLINNFTYKRLAFRFQLDAVKGVDVFNADWRTRQGVGNGELAEQEHRGQLPRGYISTVYPVEEWRVQDGSFVKLRELSLTYSVGNLGKVFKDLTIIVAGRNLISWDNYKGFDPEVNAGGQSTLLRGIDFGPVPIPRTFSFGINTRL